MTPLLPAWKLLLLSLARWAPKENYSNPLTLSHSCGKNHTFKTFFTPFLPPISFDPHHLEG